MISAKVSRALNCCTCCVSSAPEAKSRKRSDTWTNMPLVQCISHEESHASKCTAHCYGFQMINTHSCTHTRHIYTSVTPVSVSLPWACHISYPHSVTVRYVKVSPAHNKKLDTAAAALLMCALLARLAPWVNPRCRYSQHAIWPEAGGIVHLRRGQGEIERRSESQPYEQQGQNFQLVDRLGGEVFCGWCCSLISFPVEELLFLSSMCTAEVKMC